jgi:hypothetical protein
MSEIVDGFRAMKRARQRASSRRRQKADHECSRAQSAAAANGMQLTQHSDTHYTLRHILADWRWELYPGNQRIYVHAPAKERGTPYLRIPSHPWSLLDAVMAASKLTWERA